MAATLSDVFVENISWAGRWLWGWVRGNDSVVTGGALSEPIGAARSVNPTTPDASWPARRGPATSAAAKKTGGGNTMAQSSSHPVLADLALKRDAVRSLLDEAMTNDEAKDVTKALQLYEKVVVQSESVGASLHHARDSLPGPANEAALSKFKKQLSSYRSIAIERKGALSGRADAAVSMAAAANTASLSRGKSAKTKGAVAVISKGSTGASVKSPQVSRPGSVHSKALQRMDPQIVATIESEIVDSVAKVSFGDITGLEGPKQALNEMVILPARRPELFTGLRTPEKGLLLFGPPGNGKTMLAKAVACEADSVFFNISAASLTSKFVGESEKLVRTLFAIAREKPRAIIFIDEIDSILGARHSNEHEATRRLKTEFLVAFDGVGSSASDNIVVMAATNRPWDLDEAALRRFPKRIYVPLPERASRAEMVKKLLSKQKNAVSASDVDWIAGQTDGYSFSDLTSLAKDAAFGPLRECGSNIVDVAADKIRPLRVDDFKKSLAKIRPSVNPASLREFTTWRDDRGSLD